MTCIDDPAIVAMLRRVAADSGESVVTCGLCGHAYLTGGIQHECWWGETAPRVPAARVDAAVDVPVVARPWFRGSNDQWHLRNIMTDIALSLRHGWRPRD